MNVPLIAQSPIVLDVSGNGTAQVGPIGAREVWHPENAHVSVQTPVNNEAQCKIYVGDRPIDSTFRDGTFSGSSGDSTDRVSSDVVKVGQYIFAVWTGGDPGQTATLIVTGRKDI